MVVHASDTSSAQFWPVFDRNFPLRPGAGTTGGFTTQTASIGIALTQGNRDTSSINLGYEMVCDPKTHNRVKSDGLFLYGKTDGERTSNRLALNARDEFQLAGRAYTYGQLQYLRDEFKNIVYLFCANRRLRSARHRHRQDDAVARRGYWRCLRKRGGGSQPLASSGGLVW